MKYVRFYLEHRDKKMKRKGIHQGNVIAVFIREDGNFQWNPGSQSIECIAAVHYFPDSPCASTSVGIEYLRENCKRISEAMARDIHPQLFVRLQCPWCQKDTCDGYSCKEAMEANEQIREKALG